MKDNLYIVFFSEPTHQGKSFFFCKIHPWLRIITNSVNKVPNLVYQGGLIEHLRFYVELKNF
jgi:hypothetical protein